MIFHKERNIGVFKLDILFELSPNFTFHFLCETKLLNTITVSEFFTCFYVCHQLFILCVLVSLFKEEHTVEHLNLCFARQSTEMNSVHYSVDFAQLVKVWIHWFGAFGTINSSIQQFYCHYILFCSYFLKILRVLAQNFILAIFFYC